MNYFDLYSSYPDSTISAVWGFHIKEANRIPLIAETLHQGDNKLFERFAACYVELRALPRAARRSLQRRLARSTELAAVLPKSLYQDGGRLQHRMAWSLAGAALLLALGQGITTAATIPVTTNVPNIVADGQCSLIEAIVNANNDAATHADCPAGNGRDTIVLPANATVTLNTVHASTFWGQPVGLPLITSRITIEGNGAMIARDGNAPAFGLMAVSGDLTLQSVTVSGGSSGSGGGIYNTGILSIKDSTISGNTALGSGGAVYNYGGILTIENSTISDNTANSSGGGVSNTPFFYGSGVSGILTITNSTVSGNRADWGGGVDNFQYCHLNHCHAGALTLNRSLVAGNLATVGPEIENAVRIGPASPKPLHNVTANNFNLFGADSNAGVTGFTPGPTDVVPGVPLAHILGPLADNGGPTPTHALVAGSPAIDAGDPGGCRNNLKRLLVADQRGFARHVDGNNDGIVRCDIGAFEYGAEFVPVPPPPPPSQPPLTIGATTHATGEAGVSFTSDLMISGGVAPYIVSITKGALPAGLSLGNDGIISGTISQTAKSAKITVRITDSLNESVTQTLAITVLKALRIAEKAKSGRLGKSYNASLKIRGGQGPFNWFITSGALPMGLSFNTSTGAITGIPEQAGEFPLSVQVTDVLGGVDSENLTLTIK